MANVRGGTKNAKNHLKYVLFSKRQSVHGNSKSLLFQFMWAFTPMFITGFDFTSKAAILT